LFRYSVTTREPGASDLTKQQFTVLAAVEQNEGTSQTDLAAITGIDRSTLAEMIRRMTEKKLLDRERTKTDKRANAVYLSADGRKALRGARVAGDRVERMLLSVLSATERDKLLKMLAVIVSRAETGEPRTKLAFRRSTQRRGRWTGGQSERPEAVSRAGALLMSEGSR
jgi:DNA-binding MarR family transcriptional regulator